MKLKRIIGELKQTSGGHVAYFSQSLDYYVENAVSFIVAGIEDGNHIIFIENDRIFLLIEKKLRKMLTVSQLERLQHVNNFDFYWSTGRFHSPTIVSYFSKILEPYLNNNIPVLTWAHVEWGQMQNVSETILKFEEAAHESVTSMKLLSVCAYDVDRLNDELKELLLCSHSQLMTDQDIKEL